MSTFFGATLRTAMYEKSTWGTEIDFFFILKPEALCITSVSYNVLLLSTFGVLQSTEIKTPEYVFLVLKNSTLTSPRGHLNLEILEKIHPLVDYVEYEDPLNCTTPSEPHGARVVSSLWPFTVPTVGSADLHTFYHCGNSRAFQPVHISTSMY